MAVYLSRFGIAGEAVYGINEFENAVKEKNEEIIGCMVPDQAVLKESDICVVAGTADDLRIMDILEANKLLDQLTKPESLLCHWCQIRGKKVLLLAGKDAAGLMYVLLETARKIRLYGMDALRLAGDYKEAPDNRVRCMDRYIVGHLDNAWFLNDDFWDDYMRKLAYARYNRFCLIVGFDTAYMAPPYPFFLPPLADYPQVRVLGISQEDVAKNCEQLKKIGQKCHEHGLKFVFATWQQRPWTSEQDQMVENLPEDEAGLSEYCYAGLKELLCQVPEIDIVQFRVNHESGVGTQISAEDFWNHCMDAVADAGKLTGKPFVMDLRAKGLTEEMVAHAFEQNLQVEVPTKYWCEHAALPYHIPSMRSEELAQLDNYNHSRRYSYADMLEKPKRYSLIFRLWNYGSTDLFLWGDADYARRFAKSCMESDSVGYQVNAPLSLKYGHELSHKEAWNIYKDENMRYGQSEEDRFWNWYTIFGRLGYNTEADPEIWKSEFTVHFGEGAEAAEKALGIASKILPLITTVHMPVHPSLRYWPELNTGWALFEENNMESSEAYDYYTHLTYGSTEPSDHQLFYGINEYVHDCEQGTLKGKYTPFQYSAWLQVLADETAKALESFEQTCGDSADPAEIASFKVDLEMLMDLASYHASKILAALYTEAAKNAEPEKNLAYALFCMRKAADHWHTLSERGEKYYYEDLDFSSAGTLCRRGTWKDKEKEIQDDLNTLQKMSREAAAPEREGKMLLPKYFEAELPKAVYAKDELAVCVDTELLPGETLTLHYRHMDHTEGMFHEIEMKPENGVYRAFVPAEYITGKFDLMVYISRTSKEKGCRIFPGIYHGEYPYPYAIIKVNER